METEVRGEQESTEGAPASAVQRVWGVLLSPEATFRGIAARPTWALALILIVVATLVFSIVLTPRLDMKQVMRDAMEQQGQELSEAQLERQLEMAESFKWVGTASQVIIQPAVYLLMAGVFLVLLRLSGSEIDFRRSLSVAVHGMMPMLIATLLAIPILLSRAKVTMEEIQAGSLLPSNLSFLGGEGTSKAVQSLLASFDLFSIWIVVLLAIGYRIVGRVSSRVAWTIVLALWAVMIVGKAGLAAIF